MRARSWWEMYDSEDAVSVPGMQVDDVLLVQPVGFVWFQKPRYRVKAEGRKIK